MSLINLRAGLMAAGLISAVALVSHAKSEQAEQQDFPAVPGEFVVQLKPGSEAFLASEAAEQELGSIKEAINAKGDLLLVQRPMVEEAGNVIEMLEQNPAVAYAEPNYIYTINKTPNDPELSKLWGMHNVGQKDPRGRLDGVANVDVDGPEAWDLSTGSHDVVVAVIDTGIDPRIADLAPNMWTNNAEKNGTTGVDDDNNGYIDDVFGYDFVNKDGDPTDDHAHGSHCAGTIGANGDDGNGVVGVTWKVRFMALKFLSASGSGSLADAVKAIDYATANGAHLSSNSWGGGGFSQAMEDAIKRANEKGVLFVAAAGNSSANNDTSQAFPANYAVPNVLAVAAIDIQGKLASFSSYGKTKVHVGAPGVDVLSTTPSGLQIFSGTSMATPHVSGVAALLLAANPGWKAEQLKERIMRTVKPLAGLRGKTVTGGTVSAYNALANVVAPPDPNDPSEWEKIPYQLSSPHPYPDNHNQTWQVQVPGATKFALRFSKFDLENRYDTLTITDKDGKSVEQMTGITEGYGAVITGDTATLTLHSDSSVNRYGFDIDQIAVVRSWTDKK